jgi:hypothetical protein
MTVQGVCTDGCRHDKSVEASYIPESGTRGGSL